jgi:hypothetical protein
MLRRPHGRPRSLRALVATAGLLAAGLLTAGSAHADGTAPPWVPGGVNPDQAAVGGLTFYNAEGTAITSGSTNTAPFAAFVAGRHATQDATLPGATATLYDYLPQEGVAPDLWQSFDQLGLSTNYPNAAAPGALHASVLPVNTGTSDDFTLENVIADFPNPSTTAGYQNVYEIRMRTGAKNHAPSVNYDYADISVDATTHTWTLVYSPGTDVVPTAPAAPTAVHATAGNTTATVAWTAPASNGGAPITGYNLQYSINGGTTWTSSSSTFHTSTATSHALTGLTNAKPYVFRVAAINSVGTGAYSAKSAAITPVADASSLAISATSAVRYGSLRTVNAKLVDAKTHALLGGQSVLLYQRASSNRAWGYVKRFTTTSKGTASTTIRPSTNEQYQLRYAGISTHKAATSATVVTSVVQVVSIARNHSSIKHGGKVSIYGAVSPAGSGQTVYLQQLVKTTWRTTATHVKIKRQRMPNGRTSTGYVLTIKLSTKGSVRFRVYKPATSTLAKGYSASATVKAT